jgi:DNA-binding MarR family transcriptional regulator
MASHPLLRRKALLEIHRRSGGDTERRIKIVELAQELNLPANDVVVTARQLEGKEWVRFSARTLDPEFTHWSITMTIRGIEEAERMQQPVLRRWPSEHPVVFGLFMSVITGLVMLFAGRFVDRFFKTMGW